MRVEEILKYNANLESEECENLNTTNDTLKTLFHEMQNRNCDTFECCGEYTFDISDLEQTIELLEMLQNLTAITS